MNKKRPVLVFVDSVSFCGVGSDSKFRTVALCVADVVRTTIQASTSDTTTLEDAVFVLLCALIERQLHRTECSAFFLFSIYFSVRD